MFTFYYILLYILFHIESEFSLYRFPIASVICDWCKDHSINYKGN